MARTRTMALTIMGLLLLLSQPMTALADWEIYENDSGDFFYGGDEDWWNLDWDTGYCGSVYHPSCTETHNVRWTVTNGSTFENYGI